MLAVNGLIDFRRLRMWKGLELLSSGQSAGLTTVTVAALRSTRWPRPPTPNGWSCWGRWQEPECTTSARRRASPSWRKLVGLDWLIDQSISTNKYKFVQYCHPGKCDATNSLQGRFQVIFSVKSRIFKINIFHLNISKVFTPERYVVECIIPFSSDFVSFTNGCYWYTRHFISKCNVLILYAALQRSPVAAPWTVVL